MSSQKVREASVVKPRHRSKLVRNQTFRVAKKIVSKLRLPNAKTKIPKALDEQSLINLESELGSVVFGSTDGDVRREFLYHRNNNWIFHEQFGAGMPLTITYEVHDNGVVKILPDRSENVISGEELENFLAATRTYLALIKQYLYGIQDVQ